MTPQDTVSRDYKVAVLIGSTREGSLNQRLAKAVIALAPSSLTFETVRMDHLPFYDPDREGDKRPAEVVAFTEAVAAADAVLIVTPEYNRSIPAVLKNAIDWGSKPMEANVWRNKVVAMTGTSPGGIGTAIGQQHLRQILSILGSYVLPGEVYITFRNPDFITEGGEVSDERSRKFIADFAARFAKLVQPLA